METKTPGKLLAALLVILAQADDYVSVTYVAEKLHVSWPAAKMFLLRLMAEDKIEGKEIARRGWIFRTKGKLVEVSA
jgi:Mn-dependent DtxR family transcriptional regulator